MRPTEVGFRQQINGRHLLTSIAAAAPSTPWIGNEEGHRVEEGMWKGEGCKLPEFGE